MFIRVSVVILALLLAAGCTSDTNVSINDAEIDISGDSSLPSAVLSADRPDNPPTTFELSCPWGEVEDPPENPYFGLSVLPDDIASIDNPKWVTYDPRAIDMFKKEPLIVVEVAGQVRGVPVRILLWHEVVNMCWDTPDGPFYTYLTYCPLVDAGVHFEGERQCGAKFQYGVSGGIFNGNLVTFDRASNKPGTRTKLFVQLYAGGIFETCARVLPNTQHMSWEMFQRLYPYAEILSEDTGAIPPDGYDFILQPYWDYWRRGDIFFPYAAEGDRRLDPMRPVFGVLTPNAQKAYPLGTEDIVATEEIGGERIVVWYDQELETAAAFEAKLDGWDLTFDFLGREARGVPLYLDRETGTTWTFDGIAVGGRHKGRRLARAVGIHVFWFAWASFYLDTEVYGLDTEVSAAQ
jgi:hypothetical protein